MRKLCVVCVSLLLSVFGLAQDKLAEPTPSNSEMSPETAAKIATLSPGTKVLLVLKNSLSSKNARQGDGVYLETTFPVVQGGHVVIPAGTYVQGVVDSVKRSGRVKGRAELLLHFTTLIYPNGYMVTLPGALESADGNDNQKVKDNEGTVQADGSKGKDTATVATSAGTGGIIGGLSNGAKGAGIGGGLGAAVGLATVMLTRGNEVRLESGTSVEMVIQRPVNIDLDRVESARDNRPPTPQRMRRMERPSLTTPNGGPLAR